MYPPNCPPAGVPPYAPYPPAPGAMEGSTALPRLSRGLPVEAAGASEDAGGMAGGSSNVGTGGWDGVGW